MDHFAVLKPLCRAALMHSDNAAPVRRRIAQLKNRLRHVGDTEAAAELGDMLERFQPPRAAANVGEGPTPETRRKLKPDTIGALYRKGTIGEAERAAAEEIRDVFEALGRGLTPQAVDHRSAAPRNRGTTTSFSVGLERMPGRLYGLWQRKYQTWAEDCGAVQLVQSNVVEYSQARLALDVIVDGKSLREIERGFGLRNGSLSPRLVEALEKWSALGRGENWPRGREAD
jgi:hypothetical protein